MMKFAQYLRNMHKEERGFTLVELMVVVVIIGILAAVAIPKFSSVIDNSRVKADVATGKTLKDAADRYYTEHGQYEAAWSGDIPQMSADLIAADYLNAPIGTQQANQTVNAVYSFNDTTGQVIVTNTYKSVEAWNSGS